MELSGECGLRGKVGRKIKAGGREGKHIHDGIKEHLESNRKKGE